MITNVVVPPSASAIDEVARKNADRAQATADAKLAANGDGSRLFGVLKPADVGTAAVHNAGTGPGNALVLDENGALPPVDGSRLFNLPSSVGAAASETPISPILLGYKRFDAEAFVATATPSPEPPSNLALAEPDHVTEGGTKYGSDAVLGLPGSDFEASGAAFQRLVFVSTEINMQKGNSFYVAYALKPKKIKNKNALRLYIFIDKYNEKVEIHYAGAFAGQVLIHSDWSNFGGHWKAPTTADNATYNFVSADLGTGEYIVQLKLEATAAVTGTLELRQAGFDVGDRYVIAPIYAGASPYLYDSSDDHGAVKLPGDGITTALRLTRDANQVATVTAAATELILPAPPAEGIRDLVVRVSVASGSLVLPARGVTVFGEGGPFSSDVRLAIRQYGDGSSADIYAVTGG